MIKWNELSNDVRMRLIKEAKLDADIAKWDWGDLTTQEKGKLNRAVNRIRAKDYEYYQDNFIDYYAVVTEMGDKIPIYFTSVEGMKNPQVPNVVQRYLNNYLTYPYSELKRFAINIKNPPQVRIGYGGISLPEMRGIEMRHIPNVYDRMGGVGRDITRLGNARTFGKGNTGLTVIGDLHGTAIKLLKDINSGYPEPIIKGNIGTINFPSAEMNVRWVGKKQNIVRLGDIIDRGLNYLSIREFFNRIQDQAVKTGGQVYRLLGNHELAYIDVSKDILGIRYFKNNRNIIGTQIRSDILNGRLKGAVAIGDELFTHAGVSLEKFPEWIGKTAKQIADDINTRLIKAIKNSDFSDPIFDWGNTELRKAGYPEVQGNRGIGGVFWLRPNEVSTASLDLGFKQ